MQWIKQNFQDANNKMYDILDEVNEYLHNAKEKARKDRKEGFQEQIDVVSALLDQLDEIKDASLTKFGVEVIAHDYGKKAEWLKSEKPKSMLTAKKIIKSMTETIESSHQLALQHQNLQNIVMDQVKAAHRVSDEAILLDKEIKRFEKQRNVKIATQQDLLQAELQYEYDIEPLITKPKFTEGKKFIQTYIHGVKFTNNHKEINVDVNQLLEPENEFIMLALCNKLVDDYKRQFGFENREFILQLGNQNLKKGDIQKVIQQFYSKLQDTFYDSNRTEHELKQYYVQNGISFRLLIQHKADGYIPNPEFEKMFQSCVFFVKNTDNNCLVAALFCAYYKMFHQIILNGVKYELNVKYQTLLYDYRSECKVLNLYHFTMLLKELLNVTDQDTNDQIIARFEKLYDCKVTVIERSDAEIYKPIKGELLLLCESNHYNVITEYPTYIRKCNKKYNHYKYCYDCQTWYYETKQCACGVEYVEMKKEPMKLTEEEKKQLKAEKELKAAERLRTSKLMKPAREFKEDDNPNFICFDIESLFVDYETEDDNKKYVKEHKPWVICFQCVKFNQDKKTYELDDTVQYTNNYNGIERKGKFVIGMDCCFDFLKFVMQPEIAHVYNLIYAHNGAKYDNILMLQSMLKNQNKYKINPLITDGQLMTLKVASELTSIEFRDSYLLIKFPIKDFNKSLGLGLDMEKEIQEYEFMSKSILNKFIENGGSYETLGNLIDVQTLNRSDFKCSDEDFKKYYIEHKNDDYVQRYIDYCHQDVNVMVQGMIKFYETVKSQFKQNCYNYLTISSLALNLFLLNCGPEMFEKNIFDLQHNRSMVEMKFVKMFADNPLLAHQLLPELDLKDAKIVHQNIQFDFYRQYNVDVVIQMADGKKYIIEIDGVYFHGLILNQVDKTTKIVQCYSQMYDKYYDWEQHKYKDYIIQQHSQILEMRLKQHNEKAEYLDKNCKKQGYEKVYHITDLEVEDFIKENKIIVNVKDIVKELVYRNVLKGGRTECFVHKIQINPETHIIRGMDQTSLYPACMLQNLPLRDSNTIKGGDISFISKLKRYALKIKGLDAEEMLNAILHRENEFGGRVGFAKLKMLPPQDLKIPILANKICDKLLFPLCRTCAEMGCKDVNLKMVSPGRLGDESTCNHCEDERCLYDWWSDVEIIHALVYGYKIMEVYETVIYNKTTFNDPEYKGSEFIQNCMYYKSINSDAADYNTEVFEGLKQSLGYDYAVEADKKYLIFNGQKNLIKENKALKNLYKLILNSCYGKLGMNVVNESYKLTTDDDDIKVGDNPFFIGEYIYNRSVAPEELQQLNNSQSNHFLAGTVTAIGRTILWFMGNYIEQRYQGKILYSDTDSCYCVLPIQYKDVTGFSMKCTLGAKNEIKFQDATKWVCLGAKAYAYTNETETKFNSTAKGLCYDTDNDGKKVGTLITTENKKIQTYHIYDQVLQSKQSVTVKQENNFIKVGKSNDEHFTLIADKNMTKQISYNERKRIMLDDYDSIPFGFK